MEADVRLARPGLARLRPVVWRQRARLVAAASVAGYFGLLAGLGGRADWSRLGVPGGALWFGDLRSVTTAWECTRRGIAVLPVNPCDPWARPANYPRLWLAPSFLGLGEGSTFVLGLIVAAVFLAAALVVLPAGASAKTGVLYGLALCSPAVMLGIERGNVDLTLFALVAAAVLLAQRGVRGVVASGALLLLAALLKLFPVFAAGFLLRRPTRPRLLSAAAVAAGFLVYVVVTRSEIREILHAVPQGDRFSFGVRRPSEWVSTGAGAKVSDSLDRYRVWDTVLVLAGIAVAWLSVRRLRPRLAQAARDRAAERDLDLFWAGACLYVGSYAVFLSYDYRLVFVLLTVPQLARWAAERRALAYVTIAALLVALWFDVWTDPPLLGSTLARWSELTALGPNGKELPATAIAQLVLFVTLVAWLVATAPALSRRGRAAAR